MGGKQIPKGLRSNNEGGEDEELDPESPVGVYKQAVWRGVKRFPYTLGLSEEGRQALKKWLWADYMLYNHFKVYTTIYAFV